MITAVNTLDYIIDLARHLFFAAAVLLLVVFSIDWLVRTRRINPFSPIARFFRRSIHPMVTPVERAVVRAGGVPSSAPWWALAGAVIIGIVVIAGLGFVRDELYVVGVAMERGPRSVVSVSASMLFRVLYIALFVRVISTWVRVSPYSRWVRWSFVITEPLMRPLRRIVPPMGMIDLTPLAAFGVLWLLEALVRAAIGA
ncbi:MAG: YggT family protein [Gemmatimonadaceae bacterium]